MRKNDITHLIEASIKREALCFGLSKVLVALSGGADSVATVVALNSSGLEIKALHCNFHLRGDESDRDSEFVKNLCKEKNIPLEIIDFDVNKYRKENPGISVEMACRNLRHAWFKKLLESSDYQRIATGHNADDNIETFFLNMLRGSGSSGLKGMQVHNGTIWRPLLKYHRSEIIEYIKRKGVTYVTDSTNLSCDYRRNFLRNKVIPLIKDEWIGFDKAMTSTINNISAENKLVENYIQEALPNAGKPLNVEIIKNFPAPLLLIRKYIEVAHPFTTTPKEVMDSIMANKPHIRRWKLRKGVLVLRNGNLSIEMIHGKGGS